MTATPHLALPLLAAAQAQKHVTHNEALASLDALIQLSVKERGRTAAPASPAEGDRYLVGAGGAGAFAGHAGEIALFDAGAWRFLAPKTGWIAFVEADDKLLVYDGAAWADLDVFVKALANLDRLGVGTAADAVNRFAAKLNAALFTALSAGEGGTGDLRLVFNKESAANVLSLLFQSGFEGRAEIGLAGNDDLLLRVSADGAAFATAVRARRADGKVSFPQGLLHEASAKPVTGLIFTPGGDGQVSIYRSDAPRAQNPRTAAIGSVAGDLVTLAAPDAPLFFHPFMAGVSYVRIWNVSKIPAQPAWVKASPSGSVLQVVDAAAVAGWLAGETAQVGDPTSVTPNRVIALDISPMLQGVLGAAFRQSGILCKTSVVGVGGGLSLSPSGVSGSFVGGPMTTDQGAAINGMLMIPCTASSPISNSNLVFLRESVTAPNQLGVAIVSSIGVFG